MTQLSDTAAASALDAEHAAATRAPLRYRFTWQRDPANPVLPPRPDSTFDSHSCMNPWARRDADGGWRLFYAGGDSEGRRHICVATCPDDGRWRWHRRGPLLEPGVPGAFDDHWCVLPHVVRIDEKRWHLYYSGRARDGQSLGSFRGLGLAISDDGEHWQRHTSTTTATATTRPDTPVIAPTGRVGDDDGIGVAGGSVLRVTRPDGSTQWRYYYTGAPTYGDNVFLDQQKRICLATSDDAIHWHKHGAVMRRDPERDYENVAVAGPVVHQLRDGTFCMWYSSIGTGWGYYAICYAESDDGLHWRRGANEGDNLQLTPAGEGWEKQMVEYPSVIRDGARLRMFYCGNGYGSTGIGTAVTHEPAPDTFPEPERDA